MRNVYILGGMRTPFVKSFTNYSSISTQELMSFSLNALVKKFDLKQKLIDDVALGALITSSGNWNLARECVLSSGLSPYTPAYNVQRACGTSLEAAYQIYAKLKIGSIETGIAGGVDTNSDVPIEVNKYLRELILALRHSKNISSKIKALLNYEFKNIGFNSPNVVEPRTGLSMGQHCELMVKEWNVSQNDQDKIALKSHQNAFRAFESGFYNVLITPVNELKRDGFVRGDTSIEKLSKLKPAFDKDAGTITAGNASPLSDGASAVLLASDVGVKKMSINPLAKIVDIQTAAVDFVGGDGLLMAPTFAVQKLLGRNNLKLQDFNFYEIHEAFAGQVVCTLNAWNSDLYCKQKLGLNGKLGEIDIDKMNVVGGSLALGHPFAATGGRILSSIAELVKGTQKRALISICTAGGMGIAAIVEGV